MAKPPSPDPCPLVPLVAYTGRPTFPERPTFGLMALACPSCGDRGQRLMRAQQYWRDQAQLCAQIHVAMDFCCTRCTQGWQIKLFNEDEGEGEIILEVSAVETVAAEDERHLGLGPRTAAPEPSSPSGH